MRISLLGEDLAKLVAAGDGSMGRFKTGRRYDLVCVHLLRVGCPRELTAAKENKLNMPVVVEKNRRHLGELAATKYYPEAVVVCGEYRRAQLLAQGILDEYGWVERGALEVQDADVISAGELTGTLQRLIQERHCGPRVMMGQAYPILTEVHPYHNACTYELGGRKFRQNYSLNGDVSLSGMPLKINASCPGMDRPQTGGHFTSRPMPLASNQVSQFPAASADLVRMMIRDVSSETNVVDKMLSAMRTGLYKPLKPDFAPVNLSDDGKILGPLVSAGIAPADFVVWADKYMESREFSDTRRKKLAKSGAAMPHGGFPIVNREDLSNAKRAIGRAKNRAATIAHINKRAKALGAPGFGAEADMGSMPSEDEVKALGIGFHHKMGHRSMTKMHDVGGPKKVHFKV